MKLKSFFKKVVSRISITEELFIYLWQNKLWWMIPIFIVIILLGLFVWFTQSSAIAPFIYTLF